MAKREMLYRALASKYMDVKKEGMAASMNASPILSSTIKQDISPAMRMNEADPR